MFAVEIYAAVRRFVFVEGKSRREAARVFGLSRDTIAKMCRYSAPPGYVRSKAPERPKLGPLVPVIDAILEADKTVPPKQRHTAKRIFERLRIEHGFAGGYTVVKDYVRLARTAPGRASSSRSPIRLAMPGRFRRMHRRHRRRADEAACLLLRRRVTTPGDARIYAGTVIRCVPLPRVASLIEHGGRGSFLQKAWH
jgi:hypothetical protein